MKREVSVAVGEAAGVSDAKKARIGILGAVLEPASQPQRRSTGESATAMEATGDVWGRPDADDVGGAAAAMGAGRGERPAAAAMGAQLRWAHRPRAGSASAVAAPALISDDDGLEALESVATHLGGLMWKPWPTAIVHAAADALAPAVAARGSATASTAARAAGGGPGRHGQRCFAEGVGTRASGTAPSGAQAAGSRTSTAAVSANTAAAPRHRRVHASHFSRVADCGHLQPLLRRAREKAPGPMQQQQRSRRSLRGAWKQVIGFFVWWFADDVQWARPPRRGPRGAAGGATGPESASCDDGRAAGATGHGGGALEPGAGADADVQCAAPSPRRAASEPGPRAPLAPPRSWREGAEMSERAIAHWLEAEHLGGQLFAAPCSAEVARLQSPEELLQMRQAAAQYLKQRRSID